MNKYNILFLLITAVACIAVVWINATVVPQDIENDIPSNINSDTSVTESASKPDESSSAVMKKININTATLDELDSLPGIGSSKAEAIIDYRSKHGHFISIDEIKEVSGIGEGIYDKIKDLITVE